MYVHVHVYQSTSNNMSVSNSMFSDTIHGLMVCAMVALFFVIMYVQALNVILYVQVFTHILVRFCYSLRGIVPSNGHVYMQF